jgi:hypothetical protein
VTVVRNNRRFFKDLVVNWLRHTTCTITLAEAIVNAAIVIYAMEMEVIDVDKAGVTLTPSTNKDVSVRLQESISKGVKDFVLEYTKTIQNELADEYDTFSQQKVLQNSPDCKKSGQRCYIKAAACQLYLSYVSKC